MKSESIYDDITMEHIEAFLDEIMNGDYGDIKIEFDPECVYDEIEVKIVDNEWKFGKLISGFYDTMRNFLKN